MSGPIPSAALPVGVRTAPVTLASVSTRKKHILPVSDVLHVLAITLISSETRPRNRVCNTTQCQSHMDIAAGQPAVGARDSLCPVRRMRRGDRAVERGRIAFRHHRFGRLGKHVVKPGTRENCPHKRRAALGAQGLWRLHDCVWGDDIAARGEAGLRKGLIGRRLGNRLRMIIRGLQARETRLGLDRGWIISS